MIILSSAANTAIISAPIVVPIFIGNYWRSGGFFTTEAVALINMVRDLSASSSFFGSLNQYDGIEAGSCYANCANPYYYLVDATTWTQGLLETNMLPGWTSSRNFPGYLQSNYVSQSLSNFMN